METVYIFGIFSVFITAFGLEGKGTWSKNISLVGSWLWIFSIIYVFSVLSWQAGILFIIGTLILTSIFRTLLTPFMHRRY